MRYTLRYLTQNCFHTLRGTALSGLLVGFWEVLLYSLAFVLYAIVRSSIQIGAVLAPNEGLIGILIANAFSLLMAVLGIGLMLGLFAAVIETITVVLMYELTAFFNPAGFRGRGAWIGLLTAGLMVIAILFFVQQSLGSYFAALWPSGYFFWLGLPSFIFIGTNGWLGWRFSTSHRTEQPVRMPQNRELRPHTMH